VFSPIRTTDYASGEQSISNLNQQLSTIQQLQQVAETGQRIQQPSDDPAGTINAMSLNSQISRYTGYQSSAADGQDWLNQADSELQSVTTVLNQVYQATEQGANLSAGDSTSRAALASKVNAAINSVVSSANAVYNGQYLFGGTAIFKGGTVPYTIDSSGSIAYNGNNSSVNRQIGPGVSGSATVSLPGQQIFGFGATVSTTGGTALVSGTGVFAVLSQIKADLISNPGNLNTDLGSLQTAMNTVSAQDGVLGSLSSQLSTTSTEIASKITTMQGSLGTVQNADMATTLTNLQLEETAYQAALSVTAKIVQPTLASFLS
jgi:flagellar hook-associated protein 3 FlgL